VSRKPGFGARAAARRGSLAAEGFFLEAGGRPSARVLAQGRVGLLLRALIGCAALLAACFSAVLSTVAQASTESLRPDEAAPLTAVPGDPARGRAIVVDRYKGLCLLCHTGPFPEQPYQGNFAPDLGDVGLRLGTGQLRLRIVDGRQLNPHTMMPSYHRTEGLQRVAPTFRGKPILTAQEVEDVVMFLSTLRGGTSPSSKP
jgi:sulfur-oxidizing protein SoxX